MMSRRIQYFWLEIAAGLYMILAAAGIRLDLGTESFLTVGRILMPTIYLLAAGMLNISHAVTARSRLRMALLLFPAVSLAVTGFWNLRTGNVESGLLEGVIGLSFFFLTTTGKNNRLEEAVPTRVRLLPFVVGVYFMALAVAGVTGQARVFGNLVGAAGLPPAFVPLALAVTLLIGAGLIASELSKRRVFALAPVLGAAALCAVGFGLPRQGSMALAAAFFQFAALLLCARYVRLGFDSDDLSGLTDRQREIHAFERLGEGVLWATIMLSAVYVNFVETVNLPMYFAAVLIGAFLTQLSYRFTPPQGLHERRYLYTLLGVVGTFLLLLHATGGVESPFFAFGYLAIFAGTVVISWQWPVLLAVIFTAYTVFDAGMGGRLRGWPTLELSRFIFIGLTMLLTGLYTSWVSRRRESDVLQVADSRVRLERALNEANEERRQTEVRSEELRTLNADLLQMRSALMNVLEDVEESKREIDLERRQLSAILNAVGDGLVAADRDGRIYLCNPAAALLLGMEQAQLIGKTFDSVIRLFPEDGDVLHTETTTKAFRGEGARLPGHLMLQRMNGDRVAVSGTVAPLRDELDALNGVVLAVRDVTAEREIDRQKSNFIAVASHQLRTPLSAIRWFLDLLLGGDAGPLKPAQRDFLTDVHASTLRMSRLVDDLLNVSRIESGKFRVVLQSVAAAEFIQDVIKENRALIESKKIGFEVDLPKNLPKITVDTSMSLQALSNVLSNAIKYTLEGGKVSVSARVVGSGVEVEVADTGMGIPANQRHRVYEKFWRGENVLLKETVGTGLGLYLAKTVLDLTGGLIRFESEEGKGSRFFVTFPLAGP